MTAINVVLLPGIAHVFADGGHYDGKVLRRVASKVYALPRLKAVFAWSGPTFDAEKLLDAIERCRAATLPDLIDRLPAAVALLGWRHPFSAIVVGVDRGEAMGVAIEEVGRVNRLTVGSVIRTLSSPVKFDPADIVGSGVAMMEDQRARHGVAAGFIEHVEIGEGISARMLRHWPDLVAGGAGLTHAAKFGDLEVDTIHINYGVFSGVVSSTTNALIVPNDSAFPVTVFGVFNLVINGTGSLNTLFTATLQRTRGPRVFTTLSITVPSGVPHSNFNYSQTASIQDEDALDDEEYTLSFNRAASGSTAGISWTRTSLMTVTYRKI